MCRSGVQFSFWAPRKTSRQLEVSSRSGTWPTMQAVEQGHNCAVQVSTASPLDILRSQLILDYDTVPLGPISRLAAGTSSGEVDTALASIT